MLLKKSCRVKFSNIKWIFEYPKEDKVTIDKYAEKRKQLKSMMEDEKNEVKENKKEKKKKRNKKDELTNEDLERLEEIKKRREDYAAEQKIKHEEESKTGADI